MDINEVLESEDPSEYLYDYAENHGRLNSKWEKLLLEFKDVWYITLYAEYIIKGRWPEAESIILESKDIYIIRYAKWVIKDRWPEAEHIIKQDKVWWERYCEFFNIKE